MTETELKRIVDLKTYERVKKAFEWESSFEQENNYYTDHDGVLNKNHIMVRVRVVNGVSRLQVKLDKANRSPLQICEEYEYDIDGIPETLDAETAYKLTNMHVGELYRLGSSVTTRYLLHRGKTELCLDKTTYFGKTDYEVEAEYVDAISSEIVDRLTALGVKFNQKSIPKYSRFLKEFKKQL
ncbi:MAG: CYTH domain-containing protein [Clostridia bacterium]|nr:CYTH domain-containing protein [Clostridia bacterium]MBQ3471101.1 CYTH domain-containing protein [Clostridia bacterium]